MTPKERIIPIFIPHEGCPNRCAFCNQHTIAGSEKTPNVREVKEMIRKGAERAGGKASVAFYGGSFTAIPREQMRGCLEAVDCFLKEGTISGVRVSTRPDAVDREILEELKRHGVTLIELGAQSMDDGVLKASMRGHDAETVRRASEIIRSSGLSLGLQMMTGLPGANDERDMKTAEEFVRLSPAVVRIYPTLVLPNTVLSRLYRDGEYRPQRLDEAVMLTAALYEVFSEAGIRVIRMGVNESSALSRGVEAGPYHPAFGELVLSELYKRKAEKLLKGHCFEGKELTLRVPVGEESKMTGHKGSNMEYLKRLTNAAKVRINPRETLPDEVFVCI